MARMPTRDDLPQAVAQANTSIVRAPQDPVGESMMGLGNTLAGISRTMARQAEVDRKKQSALEVTRATAMLNQGLLETRANYTVQNKPDITKWGEDYQKGSTKLMSEAEKLISDPEAREVWKLKSSDDVMRYNINVGEEAQKITNERHVATASNSMDEIAKLAANTDDPQETARLMARLQDAGRGLVDSGLMTPEAMAAKTLEYRRYVAKQQALRTATLRPTETFGVLTGDRFRSYNTKLISSESSARADARPRKDGREDGELLSSALGYGQFIHDTWERIRKAHPELELDPSYNKEDDPRDGRRNYEQNIKALGVLAKENAAMLSKNGVPITEANLKLAHVMDSKAVDMLFADRGALASALFPKEAASNPDLFKGRTVGEVISRLTRQFDNQPQGAMPEFGSWLDPADRNSILRMSQSASETERTKFETDFKQERLIDVRESAMSFPTEEEALSYIDTLDLAPDVRLDAERLVTGEFTRKTRQDEAARKVEYDQVLKAIQDGQQNGASEADLLEMTKGMKDQGNRKVFNDFILQGPPRRPEDQLMNRIDILRYGTAEQRQQFAQLDLTSPEMLRGLPSQVRGQLFAEQQEILKDPGKDEFPSTQLDLRFKSAGIENKNPDDVQMRVEIGSIVKQELIRAREANGGKTLTMMQVDEVLDNVFIRWSEASTNIFGIVSATDYDIEDVLEGAQKLAGIYGQTVPQIYEDARRTYFSEKGRDPNGFNMDYVRKWVTANLKEQDDKSDLGGD